MFMDVNHWIGVIRSATVMTMRDDAGSGFRAAFGVAEFRVLWCASLTSIVGDQLARLALSILVFQRTGSPAWTALTYALTMLPGLLSGVLLTGLADRYPRRTVMVCSDLGRAALVAVMAVPAVPLPLVVALLVLVQLAEPPFAAAQGALLPVVLGERRYEAGQSIHLITHQVGLLLGFAGGGLVVAWLGTSGALAVDAVTFALSALLLRLGLRPRPRPASLTPSDGPSTGVWWAQVRAGAGLVWHDRRLRLLIAIGCLAAFAVVPEGLAAPFSEEVGAGVAGVGVLLAADPAGMVVGALLLRLVPAAARVRLLGCSACSPSPRCCRWPGTSSRPVSGSPSGCSRCPARSARTRSRPVPRSSDWYPTGGAGRRWASPARAWSPPRASAWPRAVSWRSGPGPPRARSPPRGPRERCWRSPRPPRGPGCPQR